MCSINLYKFHVRVEVPVEVSETDPASAAAVVSVQAPRC